MSSELEAAADVIVGVGQRVVDEAALDRPPIEDAREPDLCDAAGIFLDTALVRLAAARDLLPGWTATLLHQLEVSRGYLAIGRATIHDYAREELGLAPNRVREL